MPLGIVQIITVITKLEFICTMFKNSRRYASKKAVFTLFSKCFPILFNKLQNSPERNLPIFTSSGDGLRHSDMY
jgi:hypothetical protein